MLPAITGEVKMDKDIDQSIKFAFNANSLDHVAFTATS